METGALKVLDALLAGGGIGAAIGIAGLFIAWFFYREMNKEREANRTLMKERLEDTKALASILERANTALQASTENQEAREQTLRTLVQAMELLRQSLESNRQYFMDVAKRIEDALNIIIGRRNA